MNHLHYFAILCVFSGFTCSYFDKVVKEINSLLQRFLQVLAECQVLGVVTNLLHSSPLRLLCGLFGPVLVVVVPVLVSRKRNGSNCRRSWENDFSLV